MYLPTFSGLRLCCKNPQPEQIHLLDIAHGLSRTPLFAGQTRQIYTAAQHALLVEQIVQRLVATPGYTLRLAALLNTASQAYTGHMPQAVRQALDQLAPGAMAQLQARLSSVIERRFAVAPGMRTVVLLNDAELVARRIEREDLGLDAGGQWPELRHVQRPAGLRLEVLTPEQAFSAYSSRFLDLWSYGS